MPKKVKKYLDAAITAQKDYDKLYRFYERFEYMKEQLQGWNVPNEDRILLKDENFKFEGNKNYTLEEIIDRVLERLNDEMLGHQKIVKENIR